MESNNTEPSEKVVSEPTSVSGETNNIGETNNLGGINNSGETAKKKSKKGVFVALGCACVLAIGGIAFGVWAMLDGNSKIAKKDERIAELDNQLSQMAEEKEKMDNMEIEIDDDYKKDDDMSVFHNPVIKSPNSSEAYRISFDSSMIAGEQEANVVDIILKDGKIESCKLGRRTNTQPNGYSTTPVSDCAVANIDGDIFNIVEFGAGHDGSLSRIGFIMTDGSVKYTLPLYEAAKANDFSIKGKLKVNGLVRGAIGVEVADAALGYGGYHATVFVLSDGNYVKYDESML